MPKRVDGRLLATGLLATGLAAAAGCARQGPPAAQQSAAAGPREVVTAEVTRLAGGDGLSVPATVHAVRRAALAARFTAAVVELPFEVGQAVPAGALLARLDDAALQAAVAAAEASAGAAEADRKRMNALLERGAATARERDEAGARAAAAEAALSGARDNLAYAVLRAPFAGRVAARPVQVGDVVSPGDTLIELEGEGAYELRASVDAALAAGARLGLQLEARVDGLGEPLSATLRSVSAAGDPTTHRFDVKAELSPARGLRSGLFARLSWPVSDAAAVLSVPERAVFRRGGLTGVFVFEAGEARLRWVALGRSTDGRSEVRAGLVAGERVVLDPADLGDGMPVREAR